MVTIGQSKLYRRFVLFLCYYMCWRFEFDFLMWAFVRQWGLWEVIWRCDQLDQQHLHQIRVWYRYRPWELWESRSRARGSWHRPHAAVMQTWVHVLSCFWTFRWFWPQMCLEVTARGSLSLVILERVSPTRNCPLSLSCRSHTILKIPMYWWLSVIR